MQLILVAVLGCLGLCVVVAGARVRFCTNCHHMHCDDDDCIDGRPDADERSQTDIDQEREAIRGDNLRDLEIDNR